MKLRHALRENCLNTHFFWSVFSRIWTEYGDLLKQKVVLLVIYLFNYDSSKSTFFTLNMAFDVELSRFLSNKLEFFFSCNTKITRTSFFLVRLCGLICIFKKKQKLFPIMVIILFYFILSFVSNSHFQQ